MATVKKKRKTGRKTLAVYLAVLIILGAGGFFGYKYYRSEQEKIAQAKKAQEEAMKKQQAEEAARLALEKAKKEFAQLISEMRDALKHGNYALVRKLADEARALALKNKFETSEIDAIIHEMELAIASTRLKTLEAKASDVYAYGYVRTELKHIPRFEELARRWDALWKKTFANEYTVLLDLSQASADKASNAESPEINYALSKTYFTKALSLRKSHKLAPSVSREAEIAENQTRAFFTNISRSTQPTNLYR